MTPEERLRRFGEALEVMGAATRTVDARSARLATYCEGLDVAGVVDHVRDGLDFLSGFPEGTAGKAIKPSNGYSDAKTRALSAWHGPGALEAVYRLPPPTGDVTGAGLVDYLILEQLGHAIDVFDAVGKVPPIPRDVAQAALGIATTFSPVTLRAPGMFGPPIDIDADAHPVDRLAAYLGRDRTTQLEP